ncbi:Nitric oxide oxidoreductase [Cladophialophora chaetospira]|uniref:nitric oxide dioxygenase n=1 Tax=Cladophialophora chaetospira TaxID=386627 RepID=A0AA38X6S3_9EURO|nr:Nitric oxide oxidoreductase [Cladophialophora chaetospira]
MTLTKEQADTITATVPVLVQYGNQITTAFYANLLRDVPALNNVFNTSNQRNGHQQKALAGALYAYAANINNLDALKPALERICQKHVSLYIKPEQYDIVGKYLLGAMGEVLGEALSLEILEAWTAAYKQLADIMIKHEAELVQQNEDWTEWREFRIQQKKQESEEVTSFYLVPVNGKPLPEFLPGQYISLQVEVPDTNYNQARQYSLSDKYSPEYYRISVKREQGLNVKQNPDAMAQPGCVSNILHDQKKVGDIVQLSHPAGDFFLDVRKPGEERNPVVLLSAGVGLTPMTSILNTLVAKNGRQISWVHVSKSQRTHAFNDHVNKIAESYPEINKRVFHSRPVEGEKPGFHYDHKGRLDLSKLEPTNDLRLNDKSSAYYICGPERFMTELEQALQAKGVDSSRINMELFGTGGVPH